MKIVGYLLVNCILITGIQMLLPQIWWIFAPVSLLMGFLLSFKQIKIRSFFIGFLSGFLSWTGGTIFYSFLYEGEILDRTSQLFFMPEWLFVIVIGMVGGLLNALSLFTGYIIFLKQHRLEL